MLTSLRYILLILLLSGAIDGYSQIPTISYASPQVYTVGTSDVSLTPTTNDNYSYGYGTPDTIASGLNKPRGITIDAEGNIYFTDSGNNVVKEIPVGNTTPTVIGTGFNNPAGIAVDVAGNVYVADQGNNTVKKIPAGGGTIISLGSGYNSPNTVAVDVKGNVYFTTPDGQLEEISIINNSLILISSSVQYVTSNYAGNIYFKSGNILYQIPANGSSPIQVVTNLSNSVTGISVDFSGNVYAANNDDNDNSITQFSGFIASYFEFGSGFNLSQGLTADGLGNVYVSDFGNNSIEKFTPTGGFYINSNLPPGFYFDSRSGTIYINLSTNVSPATNYKITAYNPFGSSSATVNIEVDNAPLPAITYNTPQIYPLGTPISPLPPVNTGGYIPSQSTVTLASGFPLRGIAISNAGNIYAGDLNSNVIKEIPAGGGTPVVLASGFNSPTGVAVDSQGNIYVTDLGTNTVKEIPAGGGPVVTVASGFKAPYGIAVDAQGNLYVGDATNNEVKKIPAGGGTPFILASGFKTPTGVAVDNAGNVYVADRDNNLVKEIPVKGGKVITLGSGFISPNGVAVDAAGNVYVCDDGNNAIKKIPVGGGSIVTYGFGFINPVGIALDANGNLYAVNDGLAIEEIVPGGYYINPALPAGLNFNNSTGVISGTPTVESPATNYIIIGVNNTGISSATINVAVIGNANLANLAVSNGVLNPAFATNINNYTVSEPGNIASISITPTTSDSTSTVMINGVTVLSGSPSTAIPLNFGTNTISTVVTAKDGTTTKTYTVTAARGDSSAGLSGLKVSSGSLSPQFTTSNTSYTAAVGNSTTSVTVTPTLSDATATYTVNGVAVTPKNPSATIPLTVGPNAINIMVTAQDGVTSQSYTIIVTRAPSSNAYLSFMKLTGSGAVLTPAFAFKTTAYTASVPFTTTSVTVLPTTYVNTSTMKVNGVTLASGTTSRPIYLNVGSNIINIKVTAQDGKTDITYTITVTRGPSPNASLSALTLSPANLSPVFAPSTTGYTASVPNTVNIITVTPTTSDAAATVKVNGTVVTSGTASRPLFLSVGSNTINIKVTAQDGKTAMTYTITVTKAASDNASLSALKLSTGTLSPTFTTATISYIALVANTVTSITITPTATDGMDTVKVDGTVVTSGTSSVPIALNVGNNVISIVVTAQDGSTSQTYTINVKRAPSTNAYLSYMKIGGGGATLSPAFTFTNTTYTSSVPNTTASVTVTPTTYVSTSTQTVNGTALASGTTSPAIPLSVGSNTIDVVVTAQDGVTTLTYTITVTRAAGADNSLYQPLSVADPITQNQPQLTDDGIMVHQAVSPNGDGINDFLTIENIGNFPENRLLIMNRDGLLIYEARGYDNSNRVFDGHSNKTGQMQLPGTYFYSLDYTVKGITKHKTGFLVLKY